MQKSVNFFCETQIAGSETSIKISKIPKKCKDNTKHGREWTEHKLEQYALFPPGKVRKS